ncbi:MAG: transposase [Candidatus Omnitrophota bacterium]
MPRIARVVIPDYPHHITQRGNYKQATFDEDADFQKYLKWLEGYRDKYSLDILAYCLMPNHVHFVAIPREKDSLAKTFNSCHMRYAQYFNKKNKVTGHLWQGRFYSCVLDEVHLYEAVRYVENNPIRAHLVKEAEDWEWSSARYHVNNGNGKEKNLLVKMDDMDKLFKIDNWKKYLQEGSVQKVVDLVRANTLTGRPSGSDTFIEKLEKKLNRRLKMLPVGRQRKED